MGWKKQKKQQPKLTKNQAIGFAAFAAVLVAVITIGALTEDKAPKSASAATSSASPSPSTTAMDSTTPPSSTTSPSVTDTPLTDQEVLTAANNRDLAALLSSKFPADLAGAFATKYAGRTIAFDGVLAKLAPHESYKTRFDILVLVGDDHLAPTTGPNFLFRDVNPVSDLGLTGPGVPETLSEGDKVGVTATVGEYNPTQDLFFLDPVSTTVR